MVLDLVLELDLDLDLVMEPGPGSQYSQILVYILDIPVKRPYQLNILNNSSNKPQMTSWLGYPV